MQAGKKKTQTTLDGVVQKLDSPKEFTREGVRDAVTKLVVCDDQVSSAHPLAIDLRAEGV